MTADLEMTCTIIDDVLVSGHTSKEHNRNLDALFQQFMGRQLSKEGMHPRRALEGDH